MQALPDGRLASSSQDHTARLWVPKDGATEGGSGQAVYYDIGGELCSSFGLVWLGGGRGGVFKCCTP